jgi:CheY-like chemotaxis protein
MMNNDKKHILLVEDNFVAAKAAQLIFEKLGCTVEYVDDGDKAVELVKENHYDGICMDIGLPTMSGTDACIAIRKHEVQNHLPAVPIVALTGNYSPVEVELYKKAGMQDVLCKPLSIEKAEHFLTLCK